MLRLRKPKAKKRPASSRPRLPALDIGWYGYHENALVDTESYNATLRRRDLPPIPAQREGGAGGLLALVGRLLFDMNGGGYGGQMQRGAYITSFGFGYGTFNLGYIWKKNRLFRFYPLVGFGGIGGMSNTEKKEGVADARALQPIRSETQAVLHQIGFGLDFTPRLGVLRLFFGLRAGYAHPRYTSASPPPHEGGIQLGGFYLRFIWGVAFRH